MLWKTVDLEPVLGWFCHTLRPLKSHLASRAAFFHVKNKEPKQTKNLIY